MSEYRDSRSGYREKAFLFPPVTAIWRDQRVNVIGICEGRFLIERVIDKDTEVKDTEVKDTEVKDTEVKDTEDYSKDGLLIEDTLTEDTSRDGTAIEEILVPLIEVTF